MIPKIIHYTWFSNDPFPAEVQNCIDSWHHYMPDYEFRLWDMASVQNIDSPFLQEALRERKWAFASDFVRLYAVYHHGGIYLDTDVMVFKSYDRLLNDRAFIGRENSIHVEGGSTDVYLSSHCFGAQQGDPFIERCLNYYEDRHFVTSKDATLPMSLRYDTKILPFIQSEIASQMGYNSSALMNTQQRCDGDLTIYPSWYFDCTEQRDESYCRHLALGAWREKRSKQEKITLGYKIKWRVEAFFRRMLRKRGYLMIEMK